MKELVEDLKIANDNLYSANQMLEKEIERLNNIIKEARNELNDFNESYLIDEGDYGVYNLLKEIIEKLDKGE